MFRNSLLILFSSLCALSASAEAQGVWLNQVHNFGAFDEELGTVYCDFKMVNTGDEPIAVINARANCGCTTPEFSRRPVAPGDTLVIRVGYDANGRPGGFTKYINVDLTGQPKRTSLEIKGTVIGSDNTIKSRFPLGVGPMKLRGNMIAFGDVKKGQATGRYLEAYNASAETLKPVVKNLPEYINVIVEPAEVPPGERFIFSAVFHSDKAKLWGLNVDSITVAPNPGSPESLKIETIAIITEDFSKLSDKDKANAPRIDVEPVALDLKRISRSEAPIKRYFTITNKGNNTLAIRRIYCPERSVELRYKTDKIKPGKSAKVEAIVTPSLIGDTELLNARITIISNDPAHPSTIVRVVGEVK